MGKLGHLVPDCCLIRFPSTPEGPAEAATNLKQPGLSFEPGRLAEAEAGDGLQGVQGPPLPAPTHLPPHPPRGRGKRQTFRAAGRLWWSYLNTAGIAPDSLLLKALLTCCSAEEIGCYAGGFYFQIKALIAPEWVAMKSYRGREGSECFLSFSVPAGRHSVPRSLQVALVPSGRGRPT